VNSQSYSQRGQFKRGQRDPRQGKGGAKPGAGRPPELLKKLCREIVDKHKLVHKLGRIAKGDRMDQVVTPNGEELKVPPSVKNQIAATVELLDRGYGRPNQTVEIQGNFAAAIVAEVMKSLRLIPSTCPHCKTRSDVKETVGRHLLELSRKLEAGELIS
jgi:hypothetical protein